LYFPWRPKHTRSDGRMRERERERKRILYSKELASICHQIRNQSDTKENTSTPVHCCLTEQSKKQGPTETNTQIIHIWWEQQHQDSRKVKDDSKHITQRHRDKESGARNSLKWDIRKSLISGIDEEFVSDGWWLFSHHPHHLHHLHRHLHHVPDHHHHPRHHHHHPLPHLYSSYYS